MSKRLIFVLVARALQYCTSVAALGEHARSDTAVRAALGRQLAVKLRKA